MNISATIICLNEEKKIRTCLNSLDWADEIVIVDSGSTDATLDICAEYTENIYHRKFDNYIRQKNHAATRASNDWIFNIDADEKVSAELRDALLRIKAENMDEKNAVAVKRLTRYCGGWIRHCGWYPGWQTRLYNRKACEWKGDLIHEHLAVPGAVRRIDADLLHYSFDSISDHYRTADRFTRMGARELNAAGVKKGLFHILLRAGYTFFRVYVLKKGFRDGWRGFSIAGFSAFSVFTKYVRVREPDE